VPGDAKPPEFEQALDELEKLVQRLERGDVPLEEALKSFERGVELTRQCQGALQSAQQRVEILLRRGGAYRSEAFSPAEDDGRAPAAEESAGGETHPSPEGG
jgi:exodeoxyribonuclease VII small subunit